MSNHAAFLRHAAGILLAASLFAAHRAHAEGPAALYKGGPVYKDLELFGTDPPSPGRPMIETHGGRDPAEEARRRPRRVVNGDPGYVGSDYGLGKPSFTGLGSRLHPFAPD